MVPFHDPELARRIDDELRDRAEWTRRLRLGRAAPVGRRDLRAAAERVLALLVALLVPRRPEPAHPVAPAVRLPRPAVEGEAETDARRSA